MFHQCFASGHGFVWVAISLMVFWMDVVSELMASLTRAVLYRWEGIGDMWSLLCRLVLNESQSISLKLKLACMDAFFYGISKLVMMGKWLVDVGQRARITLQVVIRSLRPFVTNMLSGHE